MNEMNLSKIETPLRSKSMSLHPPKEINTLTIKQIGDYKIGQEIGSGAFGKVVLGKHILTGEKVAIKILDKIILNQTPEDYELVKQEISILKLVKHRYIVQLYEILQTAQHIFIIMEYCEGKEIMDYILTKNHLSESESLKYFQQLINTLFYLHSQNIAHRDIKIDNMLLDTNKDLKLIDFGLSCKYTDDNLLDQPCGTVVYAAPEVLEGKEYHGMLADVWSSGIVLYGMLAGFLPFSDKNDEVNKQQVIKGEIKFPDFFSEGAKDLLKHMLDVDPMTRYTLQEIKQHSWYNMVENILIPGIIVDYNIIPVDDKILNLCVTYNKDKNEVFDSVRNNKYDNNSALYYLIIKKLKREGFNSVSDLCSDEFIDYILDENNLVQQEQEEQQNENFETTAYKSNLGEDKEEEEIIFDNEIVERNAKEKDFENKKINEIDGIEEKDNNNELMNSHSVEIREIKRGDSLNERNVTESNELKDKQFKLIDILNESYSQKSNKEKYEKNINNNKSEGDFKDNIQKKNLIEKLEDNNELEQLENNNELQNIENNNKSLKNIDNNENKNIQENIELNNNILITPKKLEKEEDKNEKDENKNIEEKNKILEEEEKGKKILEENEIERRNLFDEVVYEKENKNKESNELNIQNIIEENNNKREEDYKKLERIITITENDGRDLINEIENNLEQNDIDNNKINVSNKEDKIELEKIDKNNNVENILIDTKVEEKDSSKININSQIDLFSNKNNNDNNNNNQSKNKDNNLPKQKKETIDLNLSLGKKNINENNIENLNKENKKEIIDDIEVIEIKIKKNEKNINNKNGNKKNQKVNEKKLNIFNRKKSNNKILSNKYNQVYKSKVVLFSNEKSNNVLNNLKKNQTKKKPYNNKADIGSENIFNKKRSVFRANINPKILFKRKNSKENEIIRKDSSSKEVSYSTRNTKKKFEFTSNQKNINKKNHSNLKKKSSNHIINIVNINNKNNFCSTATDFKLKNYVRNSSQNIKSTKNINKTNLQSKFEKITDDKNKDKKKENDNKMRLSLNTKNSKSIYNNNNLISTKNYSNQKSINKNYKNNYISLLTNNKQNYNVKSTINNNILRSIIHLEYDNKKKNNIDNTKRRKSSKNYQTKYKKSKSNILEKKSDNKSGEKIMNLKDGKTKMNKKRSKHLESSVIVNRYKSPIAIRELSESPKQKYYNIKIRYERMPWKIKKKGIDEKIEPNLIYNKYINKIINPFNKNNSKIVNYKNFKKNTKNNNSIRNSYNYKKKLNKTLWTTNIKQIKIGYNSKGFNIYNGNSNNNIKTTNKIESLNNKKNIKEKLIPSIFHNNNKSDKKDIINKKNDNIINEKIMPNTPNKNIKININSFGNSKLKIANINSLSSMNFNSINSPNKSKNLFTNIKRTSENQTINEKGYFSCNKFYHKHSNSVSSSLVVNLENKFNIYRDKRNDLYNPFDLTCIFYKNKNIHEFCDNLKNKFKKNSISYIQNKHNVFTCNKNGYNCDIEIIKYNNNNNSYYKSFHNKSKSNEISEENKMDIFLLKVNSKKSGHRINDCFKKLIINLDI